MAQTAPPVRNTAAVRVGRLLEIRADAGYRTPAEVDELFNVVDLEIGRVPPLTPIVVVVDWRLIPVMSPEASDRVRACMVARNGRTLRSAALVTAQAPVAVLQFARVVREAGLRDRKVFDDAEALVIWLQETLTPPETRRLREFLAESTAGRRPLPR